MINKKPWLSKTLWLNFVIAAAALAGFPVVGDWIHSHVEVVALGWAGLNAILRLVSSEKLSLNE